MPDTKIFQAHPPLAGPCLRTSNDITRASKTIIKMSLALFQKVPAGAIEPLFDELNQPLFKRVDFGKYLDIKNIRDNFKEFSLHHAHPRSEIEDSGVTEIFGRAKNSHDIFINLYSATETAVRSKKVKAIALVKWFTKKGVEKIQEHYQQAIIGRDNQIQALEFMNEEERQTHQQQILRLNEEHQQSLEEKEHEINDLIANRHVARRGCFDNVLWFIKKNSGEVHPYYVIRCQYR